MRRVHDLVHPGIDEMTPAPARHVGRGPRGRTTGAIALCLASFVGSSSSAWAQLTDVTQTPNAAQSGIRRSLLEQVGAGRGDPFTLDSSSFVIARDPFRAISRGRQLFQRKFTAAQGLGPRAHDGVGDIENDAALGAGLSDSCAACHGRPHGSAGVGGSVYTRPDGRDAPHLFGLGLVEMLADEITADLRAIRTSAENLALQNNVDVTLGLISKGIEFGSITARPDGSFDTAFVRGVNADLRVRPFFADGRTVSIREFVVGAFQAEMGLQVFDRDLRAAANGLDVVTPAGMQLSGSLDTHDAPPAATVHADPDGDGVVNEVPTSLVDFMEFYLLNYFAPATARQTTETELGLATFHSIGCATCHVQDLGIDADRRVADVRTQFDEVNSNRVFNQLFATASLLHDVVDDGSGWPALKPPRREPFLVRNIFADFRRHDLGPAFHERNFNGTVHTQFMTEPLWGVGSTAPYGHDGRSATLTDVILRHGGEAQAARDGFAALPSMRRRQVLEFLESLVIFAPPDTASNLAPVDPQHPQYPLLGQGSIDLSVLFVNPAVKE